MPLLPEDTILQAHENLMIIFPQTYQAGARNYYKIGEALHQHVRNQLEHDDHYISLDDLVTYFGLHDETCALARKTFELFQLWPDVTKLIEFNPVIIKFLDCDQVSHLLMNLRVEFDHIASETLAIDL